MENTALHSSISSRARALEASKIRAIAELGMHDPDVIPLYFGEGAWKTGTAIVDAAIASLKAGNHLYQPNNGAMKLRQAICNYSNDLLGSRLTPAQVTVTPSGMQGLMLAAEFLVTPGDRVVAIEPGWPNFIGAFKATGAEITSVPITP